MKPSYAGSNLLSPTSDLINSPYYVPPMSSAVNDKLISPIYDSVGSDIKQVTSPDYNPATPGYLSSHQFINLVDDPIQENSEESD